MPTAMIYLHEVHEVLGGKMEEFSDALRTRWRPLLEEDGQARLLWYWELTHGTGPSYQAVSIAAVRDWTTWGPSRRAAGRGTGNARRARSGARSLPRFCCPRPGRPSPSRI